MPAKGQTLSKKSIEQMKISKAIRQLSNYNWDIIDEYLDAIIDNGSVSRTARYITLREFKELSILGNSLNSLIKQGISKHLLAFYSNFCQGKIKLTKRQFLQEYIDIGISLDDIAQKYKIPDGDMTYLRQLYGAKRRGAKYQHRKRTEPKLTLRQVEILYGTMMGDTQKFGTDGASFLVRHGEEQKDYVFWMYKEFQNIASKNSLKNYANIDNRNRNVTTGWQFYTHANSDVQECSKLFYNSGHKEVNQEILSRLTPLSIAVWFQDDGKTGFGYRSYKDNLDKDTPTCTFCTESFSKQSCEIIQKWFLDKYGIGTQLKEKELSTGIGYRIKVNADCTYKFFEMIKPYVIPLFYYKIDYKAYLIKREIDPETINKYLLYKTCPTGEQFKKLLPEEQEDYVNKFVSYFLYRGFEKILPRVEDSVSEVKAVFLYDTSKILYNDCIGFLSSGNTFLLSHFQNFWQARAKANFSAKELFENPSYLSEIIRKILFKGKVPKDKYVLNEIKRFRGNKSVSGFMPCIAKAIYDKYCNENSSVLDFCAGYGGRLFGAMASKKVASYTGIEVDFETCNNLEELYASLKLHTEIKKPLTILNQGSIIAMQTFRDKVFDFCFTSPPYFNAEEYSEKSGQSYQQFITYGNWFNEFLVASIQEARRVSKKVAINIANTGAYLIADDLERWLQNNSIVFEKFNIRYPKFGGGYRFEPIFLF